MCIFQNDKFCVLRLWIFYHQCLLFHLIPPQKKYMQGVFFCSILLHFQVGYLFFSLFFFFFFLRFYLFIHERHRERQRHRQRAKQAPCREPDVGLDPRTPGSCPGPKADAKPLSNPGIPNFLFFKINHSVKSWRAF